MVIILLMVSSAAYLANLKCEVGSLKSDFRLRTSDFEFYLLLELAETSDVGISEHTRKVCHA